MGGESVSGGRFVGIGISDYDDERLRVLEHALSDVTVVRALLGDGFTGEPLEDADESTVREHLRGLKKSLDGGPLVVLWSGHGLDGGRGGVRLLCRNSDPDETGGLSVADVVGPVALSGAGQVLVILDTCFSGGGLPDATDVAAALLGSRPPQAEYVWVGVLASCAADETAVDGRLGELLRRLLTPGEGPRLPHVRRRWSAHDPRLRGDDLCDAVLKEWEGEDRRPQFRSDGSAWYVLANPLYRPGAPRQVVEHLLRAARSGEVEHERSWFTGRTAEVDTVVGWVSAAEPGVRVVTGPPGTGKSAIVGRVVSLADPIERAILLRPGRTWAHTDPALEAVDAHAHARALTADRLANLLDEHLCGGGYLDREDEPRNALELLGKMQRMVEGGARRAVVVVDGLDEARGEAFTIATDFLVRLGRWASVIVSTRPTPGPDGTLVEVLEPVATLDLGSQEALASGRAAVHDYIVARLTS